MSKKWWDEHAGKERLNKFLSEAGVCSRREADRLIEAGAVTVNGEPAVTGMRVSEEDTVLVKGKKIRKRKRWFFC